MESKIRILQMVKRRGVTGRDSPFSYNYSVTTLASCSVDELQPVTVTIIYIEFPYSPKKEKKNKK